MKPITLSESFKTLIERNKERSKICKALSIADRLPLSIHCQTIDYLTTRPNGIISYLPKGRELKLTDNGQWAREGRSETRAGRIIQQIFSASLLNSFSTRDVEIFANIVSGYESDLNYTIVKGWDIVSVYDEKTPVEVIYNSCMQNKDYWDNGEGEEFSRVQLYALNPERVECLVFRDEQGQLVGRVLKWLTDCGSIVVDRTYASELIREQVHNICAVNGWYKKETDDYRVKDMFIFEGRRVKKEFKVTLKNASQSTPYLDCFTYGIDTAEGLQLTNVQPAYIPHKLGTATCGDWSDNGELFIYCPITKIMGLACNWEPSEFYGGRLVNIHETYNTNLGRIYRRDFTSMVVLKHKGKTYTNWNSVTIGKSPVSKGKHFKRSAVTWQDGYEVTTAEGQTKLILETDGAQEIRQFYAIRWDNEGNEVERVQVQQK